MGHPSAADVLVPGPGQDGAVEEGGGGLPWATRPSVHADGGDGR